MRIQLNLVRFLGGRSLGLKPAHLSALTKGKNGLSPQSALRIAQALGLDAQETDYFCLMVQAESAKTPELKDALLTKMRELNSKTEVKDLSVDLFKMMSDWYHIPLLEMTEMAGFELSAENAAKRLGISKLQAEVAIERLERLELLEKDPRGRFKKVTDNYVFKSNKPNLALRAFHKQMLEKAIASLEAQTPKERYVGSQTFAIDPAQLEEAAEIIGECRQKIVELFDRGKKRTQTYHLGIQLFNLTKGDVK